ncbi:hypothetical protein ES711_02670 [Gelidibacter salicanalis]|uniref:Uncharacterized protein n=1 Tax=Gelidibacter salicanalis TaxID=291193 RepID=A0A5C7AQ06_9FLAO|nr:hypothetical protein [Gelidibacter salicanalis]TXE10826.1 hypothetical protein ES711_02670 [Gelidibacter salicanalis]
MSDRDVLVQKLNQLSRENKISPYDKNRILQMPTEKGLKMDIISNTILKEGTISSELESIDFNSQNLDNDQVIRLILKVQKEQLIILEEMKKNTSMMVMWLVIIPIILSVVSVLFIFSLN